MSLNHKRFFVLTVCVRVLSSSSRTSCHPAAADGLQRKLAQRVGAFFLPNGGANESSVSPFPCNLAGSRTSFPPNSVKSPKILMLTSLLYKPSWPTSHASHFPSLPVAYLVCFSHNLQWHWSVVVAQPLRRHQRIAPAGRLHRGGSAVLGIV